MALFGLKGSRYVATDIGLLTAVTDDYVIAANAINPAGAATPATVNQDNGLLEFANAATNTISFQFQAPHSWKEGSAIVPHVHWRKKTAGAGDVTWKFEYEFIDMNGTFTDTLGSSTKYTVGSGITDDGTALKHLRTDFDSVSPSLKISFCGICRLNRLGSDGNDTYTGVAQLISFDFHLLKDTLGSDAAGSKTAV